MKKIWLLTLIAGALLLTSCSKPSSSNGGHADSRSMTQIDDYYTCPMHPQVHKDKPGVCPICGMDLVKASNSNKAESDTTTETVTLNKRAQMLADIATTQVVLEDVGFAVRAIGTLVIPEPQKTVISARFSGRTEKLYVDAVGASVKRGDPLFDFYSPDIIQAENEYLQVFASHASLAEGNGSAARSKLNLMGLTDEQIRMLESSKVVPLLTTYYSPATGTVIDKRIVAGAYFSEGAALYDLSDLATLWNIADLNADEAGFVQVGTRATITVGSERLQPIEGRVAFIYPVVDDRSRTVKVRSIVNNAGGRLRPNMFTETTFSAQPRKVLTVPVGAVLMSGKRNVVYARVDHGDRFVAKEIGLGSRFNNKYEIVWGLLEGEEVVTEGGYLIDSESQLRVGAGSAHRHGTSGKDTTSVPMGHEH
jgi:membrane fusion protein, copper/silver efflux system